MSAANVIFFGCLGEPGHVIHDKVNPRRSYWNQPLKRLDGQRLLDAGVPDHPANGRYIVIQEGGWTAVSFWDHSGDSRGHSNSAFLVAADMTGEELLTLARTQWPEIFTRRGFPPKLVPWVGTSVL